MGIINLVFSSMHIKSFLFAHQSAYEGSFKFSVARYSSQHRVVNIPIKD